MILLTDEIVRRARSDRGDPRGEIRSRLEQACDRHLRVTAEELFRLGPAFNFFAWCAAIEELGAMSALTGDRRYLDHLLETLSPLVNGGWQRARFDAHLCVPFVLTSLAGCEDLHGRDLRSEGDTTLECLVAELAECLARELATQPWGRLKRIPWNHTIIGYASLGTAALVISRRHPDAYDWLERSLDGTRRFLDVGLSASGMTWEGLKYCGFVFKHLGPILNGARNVGLEAELAPEGSEAERKLRQVPVWFAHELFPRGHHLQNYNDSEWNPHPALMGFLAAFAHYQPELCAAIWDRLIGREGRRTYGAHQRWSTLAEAMWFFPSRSQCAEPFAALDHTFVAHDVGYVSARNHWSTDASVFTFNCGPFLHRVHDQSDNNSFTFIGLGSPIVIDSGSANDDREGSASSSLGHNLVLVDGLGEHPAGKGAGVSGHIIDFTRTDDVVCVVGDATASYSRDGYNPVQRAIRTAVFVRRPTPYVLIHDDIQKDAVPHRYEFVVHVPSGDESGFSAGARTAVVTDASGIGVGAIEVCYPDEVTAAAQEFKARTHPYRRHRLWRFGTDAVNPRFVVLIRPLLAGVERPVVRLQEAGNEIGVRLQWEHGMDEIVFTDHSLSAMQRAPHVPLVSRSRVEP